jgi:hypothetical protein
MFAPILGKHSQLPWKKLNMVKIEVNYTYAIQNELKTFQNPTPLKS